MELTSKAMVERIIKDEADEATAQRILVRFEREHLGLIEAEFADLEAHLTRNKVGWFGGDQPPVPIRPSDFPAHGPLAVGGYSKPAAAKD